MQTWGSHVVQSDYHNVIMQYMSHLVVTVTSQGKNANSVLLDF